jgi:glycosyltransferase involved in cell wall biosynthesis
MGLLFYPRGGSAQVARYLAAALGRKGWPVRIFAGSSDEPGAVTNAATFFAALEVTAADFTPALEPFDQGDDSMATAIPFHPSSEDRVGAPDRLFASLDDREAERQVVAWQRLFAEGGAAEAAIAHLHHLTPQHDALARVAPNLAVVAHLHGTELKMLEGIRRRRELAVRLGTDLEGNGGGAAPRGAEAPLTDAERELLQSTQWEAWRHGDAREARLQANARRASCLIAIAPHDRDEAVRLLGIEQSRVEVISNGVNVGRFDRHGLGRGERLARWRAWLADDPRGWDASGVAGSVRYGTDDLAAFADAKTGAANRVLLYVGRFLAFKRVPLLVRAYQRARSSFERPAPLVIWGGHPTCPSNPPPSGWPLRPCGEVETGKGESYATIDCEVGDACRCDGRSGGVRLVGRRLRRWGEPRHVADRLFGQLQQPILLRRRAGGLLGLGRIRPLRRWDDHG